MKGNGNKKIHAKNVSAKKTKKPKQTDEDKYSTGDLTTTPIELTFQSIQEKFVKFFREGKDDDFESEKLFDSKQLDFDTNQMWKYLEKYYLDEKKKTMKFIQSKEIFKHNIYTGLTIPEQRHLVFKQVAEFTKRPGFDIEDLVHNIELWNAKTQSIQFLGNNMATKFGVHFMLFGVTVLYVGTEKHRKKYMKAMQELTVRGAFCLTELGHGSNARAIETQAWYDKNTKEFILNTPNNLAQKYWIGNLAQHCTHGVIFAQLKVDGKARGVHAFIVRLRDDKGEPTKDVIIGDCGPKGGLNGVDNGRLWLKNKRVPKDALLNKFGDVTDDGKYVSQIKSNTARFGAIIGCLVTGRALVAQNAITNAKMALKIAVRYALTRRQFGPSKKKEIVIMDHFSHQLRLIPLIAGTYAYNFLSLKVQSQLNKRVGVVDEGSKDFHILAAALKPAATWHRSRVLQECREACGGMGFHASSRICTLREDTDIDLTWEGDNNVLTQQVSASLLKELRHQFQGKKKFSGMFAYLKKQLQTEIKEKNIYQKFRQTEESLMEFELYKNAFQYRESVYLRQLMNMLRERKRDNAFDTWNNCLDVSNRLALAYTDRITTEIFIDEVKKAPLGLQPMLHNLCSLFALGQIQKDLGWFMTHNYFSQSKGRAIQREISILCRRLRPHVLKLVESFGIPDELLNSTLLHDWDKLNEPGKVMGYPIQHEFVKSLI